MSVVSDEDRRDIHQSLVGDEEAYARIIGRYQPTIAAQMWRFSRDVAVVEELVQEAFLRAFRKLTLYKGTAAFSSWLYKLTARVCISEMRRHGPPPSSVEDLDRLAHWGVLAESLETRDLAETVRSAVTRLPDKYRDALTLFYFLDKDLTETASALDVPTGTIKARLHRGREMLRERLARRMTPRPAAEEA